MANSVCRWESAMVRSRLPSFRYRKHACSQVLAHHVVQRDGEHAAHAAGGAPDVEVQAVPNMLTKFTSSMAVMTSSSE
jgi:hypothetical protein